MSAEGVRALAAKAAEDAHVAERLTAAKTVDEVVSVATDLGLSVTAEDLKVMTGELSDAELSGVSGGTFDTLRCPSGILATSC